MSKWVSSKTLARKLPYLTQNVQVGCQGGSAAGKRSQSDGLLKLRTVNIAVHQLLETRGNWSVRTHCFLVRLFVCFLVREG
ncbi:MAG TPA: hypothetical protein DDZ51_02730 [Planctomycetaceae bacterium]|nr:hypothetical protein [Planctomycetaceae bacterium]